MPPLSSFSKTEIADRLVAAIKQEAEHSRKRGDVLKRLWEIRCAWMRGLSDDESVQLMIDTLTEADDAGLIFDA